MKKVGILRCMQTEDYCPFAAEMEALLRRRLGPEITVLDYTH